MGYFEIWRFKIRPMVFPSIERAATASQPSGPSAFSCSWIFSNLFTPPMLFRSTLYYHFICAALSTFRTAYKKSLACRSWFLALLPLLPFGLSAPHLLFRDRKRFANCIVETLGFGAAGNFGREQGFEIASSVTRPMCDWMTISSSWQPCAS